MLQRARYNIWVVSARYRTLEGDVFVSCQMNVKKISAEELAHLVQDRNVSQTFDNKGGCIVYIMMVECRQQEGPWISSYLSFALVLKCFSVTLVSSRLHN